MEEFSDFSVLLDQHWDDSAVTEKTEQDDVQHEETVNHSQQYSRRPCSWIRKRNHKKKMVRRFLSMNPAYDYSKMQGIRPEPSVWLNSFCMDAKGYYDPMLTYGINPYYHIYLSPRGDLRIYHGVISFDHGWMAMANKNPCTKKKTNKTLRRITSDDDMIHGSYRKYGIPGDFIW